MFGQEGDSYGRWAGKAPSTGVRWSCRSKTVSLKRSVSRDKGILLFLEQRERHCCKCLLLLFSQLCSTLCDSMDCNTPGLPVLYHLPKLVQTHVHWVGDAIQPSHPLSPPSPPALILSQDQGLFQWVVFFTSGGQSTGASADCLLQKGNFYMVFMACLLSIVS